MSIRLNNTDVESKVNVRERQSKGVYILADNPNLYEVQRTNNFEFVVTGVSEMLRVGAIGTESNAYVENAQEVLRLSNVKGFVPHFTQTALEVRRGNNVMKYADVPSFDSGTLTYNDYIGADTKAVLEAWQNLSYNVKTEKVGLASDYKKDCYMIEYTPDLQKVRQYILHGCWISSLSESDRDHESNNKSQITVTIQYDWAEPDTNDLV